MAAAASGPMIGTESSNVHGRPRLLPVRAPCQAFPAQTGDGRIDRRRPRLLQSIIRPRSGQPGSLRLSDFSLYKQAGKQPPNFAIIMTCLSES